MSYSDSGHNQETKRPSRSCVSQKQQRESKEIRLPRDQVQSIRSSKRSSQRSSNHNKYYKFYQLFDIIKPQSFQKATCHICETEIPFKDFVQFGTCDHKFCQECTVNYLAYKIDNYQLIQCPLEQCNLKIQKQSQAYKKLNHSQRLIYQKIQEHFQILSNPNIRRCQKQNCIGRFEIPERMNQQKVKKGVIECPLCSTKHCSICYSMDHEGICDKDMIKFLQRNKKFRQCGKCKRVVQKSQGCTHMTCLCGHYFCYMCGQQLKGEHVCKKPTTLNCLQMMRWDIQHQQLFYETNRLSFSNCLNSLDLSSQRAPPLRFLYSILYIVTIYPFTIVLSIVAIVLFFVLVIVFMVLVFTFIPLIEICGNPEFWIARNLYETCGFCTVFWAVILFYPIFIISILLQTLCHVCQQGDCSELSELFGHIGIGLRNVIMMPFVLCVNPNNLDVEIDN